MIGRLKCTYKGMSTDEEGKVSISFTVDNKALAGAIAGELRALPESKRKLTVQIDRYRKDRTAEQNALMWELLKIMAGALHCNQQTVYVQMLERHGVSEFLAVQQDAVERLNRTFRHVKVVKPCKVNDKDGVVVQAFYSSKYFNTKEMTEMIDGILDDMKDMEIDTAEVRCISDEWRAMK